MKSVVYAALLLAACPAAALGRPPTNCSTPRARRRTWQGVLTPPQLEDLWAYIREHANQQ